MNRWEAFPSNTGEQDPENPIESLQDKQPLENHVEDHVGDILEKPKDFESVGFDNGVEQIGYLDGYLSNGKSILEQRLNDDRFDYEKMTQNLEEIYFQENLLNSVRGDITSGGDLTEILVKKYDEIYQVWEQNSRVDKGKIMKVIEVGTRCVILRIYARF